MSDGSTNQTVQVELTDSGSTNLINLTVPQYTDGYYTDDDGNLVDGAEFDTIISSLLSTVGLKELTLSDITANTTIHRLK